MRAGYCGEIDARALELDNKKSQLEALCMNPKDEAAIAADPDTKGEFEKALKEVEGLLPTYASTLKSVKMAIVTQFKMAVILHKLDNHDLIFLIGYCIVCTNL